MRLATSACLVLALFVHPAASSGEEQRSGSRVRCLDPDASRLVALARGWSPSVRQMLEAIEQSDVIVFVRLSPSLTQYRAETRFISATAGARYLVVSINPRADEEELAAMLGHELQHVLEIAAAKEAQDAGAVLALFKRIGWSGRAANGFETAAAIDAGHQVAREVRGVH